MSPIGLVAAQPPRADVARAGVAPSAFTPPAAGVAGRGCFASSPIPSTAFRTGSSAGPRRVVTTMAAKKVTGIIKLAIEAGKANPAPPIGPALGAKGVNIMEFCKAYNARTAQQAGQVIPVEITVFEDRSFTFVLKTPPASKLIAQAAGIKKGSGTPNRDKVGSITVEQVMEIAKTKLPDLNTKSVESAMRSVAGTARNMGVTIEGEMP